MKIFLLTISLINYNDILCTNKTIKKLTNPTSKRIKKQRNKIGNKNTSSRPIRKLASS
jgi:hypothetical protein